jgi:diaminohydroxyphosphoribosylaminopyrimidine deaminase/5-amino-6-(5-phosphoribosylamino)uracil reductase
MIADKYYIEKCIELAKKGIGTASPNPIVGAVIVKDGKVIACGHHKNFGCEHAEVNAIKKAKDKDLVGSTLYLNLEPCSIFGKTPPCVDLIIEKKIARVVCGTKDPNPKINGNGIRKLKKAGVKTKVGVLSKECSEINEKFFKYITTGMPFVTVKIAQTIDGKISYRENGKNNITCLESRKYVHKLRIEHDAILVGSGTIKTDNPFLTVRHLKGRQPFRVVLNSKFDINLKSNIFNDDYAEKTILIVSQNAYKEKQNRVNKLIKMGVKIYPIKVNQKGSFDTHTVLALLSKIGISSVLVEGGSKVFTEFITKKLFDSLLVFIAPKIAGSAVPSIESKKKKKFSGIHFSKPDCKIIGNDILYKVRLL